MLRDAVKNRRKSNARPAENLAGQYKPVALRAVLAAASQRKPEQPRRLLQDVPPVLRDLYA